MFVIINDSIIEKIRDLGKIIFWKFLTERYSQFYQQLADAMREQDETNPYAPRAIVLYELPNLLRAVYATLQTGGTETNVEFADHVSWFLRFFGLQREYQNLTEAAIKAGGSMEGSAWFTARFNLGEQRWLVGQSTEAEQIFQDILTELEETPSYNRCLTLGMLARCCKAQGQPVKAEQLYQQELVELAQLKQCQGVREQTGSVQIDLADVLRDQGKWHEAKAAYQAGLEIAEELGHKRNVAVSKGQLSTLAQLQGEMAEAQEQCEEVIILFQSLGEPTHEAIYTHQLGVVYQQKEDWEAAEQAYRQAARLFEEQSLLAGTNGAASNWGQLAQVCVATERLKEAERWYNKALVACRTVDDRLGVARTLYNLAILLVKDPARLDEARGYAEESLTIKETLDPAAVTIWTTYSLLTHIADQQGESSQAAEYRAKSRKVYLAFPGWRQQLEEDEELIDAVVEASIYPEMQDELEAGLDELTEQGWDDLVDAIQYILDGERDEGHLSEPLDYEDAAVIRAILEGIAGEA